MAPVDLSKLDEVARIEYKRELEQHQSDPERTRTAYDAQFLAVDLKEQLDIVCMTAKQLLSSEDAELNIIAADKQITVASASRKSQEFPSEGGYCQYVVNEKAPFGVEAALEHSLVCTSFATVNGGLRSYLGVPIIYKMQYVGALCVWGKTEREWTTVDVASMVYLAGLVMTLMGSHEPV